MEWYYSYRLYFPTFLFIVGVSIVLSFTKQIEIGRSRAEMTKKVLIRALKIYGVGIDSNIDQAAVRAIVCCLNRLDLGK